MKYYVVSAKCGHVGRNNYIIKKFFVKAETGEDAAQIVKDKPRVKHSRRDAIQSVIEINEEQYLQGLKEIRDDMYFKVHCKQQQIRCGAVNDCEVFRETSEAPKKYKKSCKGQQLKYEMLEKEWKKSQTRWYIND